MLAHSTVKSYVSSSTHLRRPAILASSPEWFLTAVLLALQDTVAVQELRFGDNDTLSAQVATLVEADYLFLMTDVDALYTANPKVSTSCTSTNNVCIAGHC